MLLRFAVSNHRSLYDEQHISLVTSSLKDTKAGLLPLAGMGTNTALPAAVIYGANASGKSNVVSALRQMCSLVLHSHNKGRPEGGVPRKKFALSSNGEERPTTMEIDFILNGVRYEYGFTFDDEVFLSEWLTSYPTGRPRSLFLRENSAFTFGRFLKGKNKLISEMTRDNSLFVSTAAQNGHEELTKVAAYFSSIRVQQAIQVAGGHVPFILQDEDVDERTLYFLQDVGTGVVDFERTKVPVPEETLKMRRGIHKALSEYIEDDLPFDVEENDEKIKLAHQSADGVPVFFDLDMESEGTRRLLVLLTEVFKTLDEGTILIIDELDASLHTQACSAILALFCHRDTNPNGAQLIATTHDTNLLYSSFLRRDQIWFTEKNRQGATEVFPLTDISTRQGDNIETGYKQGRFGALAMSKSLDSVIAFYATKIKITGQEDGTETKFEAHEEEG